MKPWEMNWENGNAAIDTASSATSEPWNNDWQQTEEPELNVDAYNGSDLVGEPGEDAKPFEKMSLFMKKLFTFEVRDASESQKNNPRIQALEKLRRDGFDDVKWNEVGKSAVRGFLEVGKGVTASPLKIYGDWAMDNRDTSLMTALEKAEVKQNNFNATAYKRLGEYIEKMWDYGLNAQWLKQDKELFEGSFVENPSMTRALSLGASAAPSIGWLGGLAKLTGSTTLASIMLAGADADDIYFEAREAGESQNKALGLFAAGTAGTAVLEKAGFEQIFSQKVTAPLAKKVVSSMLSEGVTEGTQTLWQNMVKKYGYNDSQDLWEAVIESVIGGSLSGGAISVANAGYVRLQDVRGRLQEKGMTESGLDQVQEALVQEMGFHKDTLNPLFQTRIEQSLNKLDNLVKQSEETAEVKKAQQIKADLNEVYNRVFDQIKANDTDKVASAQAKVVQGVALWGSQELGISPLEYFEQRFPRIERVAYKDFSRRLNEAKRAGEVAEINLYEALKNPALLKGHKVKDTRQSLTQFLKQSGGLKDTGGDLKAMDAGKQLIGLINNKNGRNLDDMALAAWEAGYFPQSSERPTVNDLLDAISEELGGNKRYNAEAPYNLQDEVNQLAEDLDRIDIDWRNMDAPEIEMAVDAYMERQRAYNEEMGQEDVGDNGLSWFQGKIAENGRSIELTINSQEEMKGLNDEDFKNKMLDTLKSFKGNKIFNQSLNGDIEIRTSSIKKYKSFFADKNKRLIVPYIPELLAKAKFISENTYTPEIESNIIAYWKADLPINIDSDSYNVHLTVKEDNNGNFFWDAQVKEKAPRTDPATNPGDKGLTSEISEDALSISLNDENVNNPLYQSAFAGSRVDYDVPSLEAIGTGEGNQAHGWGLYYALSKDVAEGYRKKFITGDSLYDNYSYKGNKELSYTEDETLASIVGIAISENKDIENIIKEKIADYEKTIQVNEENIEDNTEFRQEIINDSKEAIAFLKNLNPNDVEINKGQTHEVDIPENLYLLDEDLPVNQQSDTVRKAVRDIMNKYPDDYIAAENYDAGSFGDALTGKSFYKQLMFIAQRDGIADKTGQMKFASKILEENGIKGITYDGHQDGRCFVIFNPADVKVIQKFYQEETLYRDPKGAYSQRIDHRAVISLFERADASTFMHETAHFFFEELKAFASTSEKSAKMLDAVNNWLRSDGKTYTLEQTEQFARGFEQYLREGKAPSSYLKRVFDAFMNWMRNLYKTAKELNVKLNDEVRGVYGEILGGADLDRYMDAPVAEVLGSTKKYWKAKREAMDDIYKQNVDAKKISARLFKRGRETMQNVYADMSNYLSDAIVPLEEEIKQISPELYNMNRRLEIDKLQKTSAYYKRIKGFVEGMQKMDAPDFYTFDLALKNRDVDTVQRLLEKYALTDGFAEVRNILDDLREQMIDVGVDVAYMPDYFPRKIKDADGLLDYVEQEFGDRQEYSIIQKMIEEKRKDGRIRTKEDEAQIVNSLIRGYSGGISIAKIGNVKERSIDIVDQHMNRFYKVSTDALVDYISGAVQMIENKKYFGRETKELQNLRRMVANRETTIADYKAMEPKEAKWKEIKTRNYKIGAVEAQIRNTFDKKVKAELQDRKTKLEAEVEFLSNRRAEQVKNIAINRMEVELAQVKKEVEDLADSKIENSVGNLLLEMAEQGKISHSQELRLKELLLARFSNKGLGNEFWRIIRDGGYIWTLGNFESAITQFGDLGTSAYKNGLWNTAFEYVKAWRGKSEITIDDLGLGKVIQDGGYADISAFSKLLDGVLKYTGFEKMDKVAKQTLVNSAIRKARADAKAEKPELEAYLRQEFGEKWVDVKEDMKTGAITDEILEYAMFQLMDVQPITIDQMPRYYAEGGKKRLFYMMKSYFIKQLNEYRKICFDTAKTNPRKAVVDMTRLTVYLMLFNAGADVLKDLLFGRPVNVPDTLVDNIFIGGSINRYQAMSVKREGFFKTLQKQLMFSVMMDELIVDALSNKEVKDWNTWKNVPLVGRPYYWWFGGGHLKTLKEEKKARNERRNRRRRRED